MTSWKVDNDHHQWINEGNMLVEFEDGGPPYHFTAGSFVDELISEPKRNTLDL